MGGACEKKTPKARRHRRDQRAGSRRLGRLAAPDRDGPVDTTPLPGIDYEQARRDKQQTFYKLVGSLKSPCGKAALACARRSRTDTVVQARAVRRALRARAARGRGDRGPRRARSTTRSTRPPTSVKHRRREGAARRRRRRAGPLVEFFDYGCPHCQLFKPHDGAGRSPTSRARSSTYFMMFPLEKHHRLEERRAGRARRERAGQVQGDARRSCSTKTPRARPRRTSPSTRRSSASTWRSSRPTTTRPRAQVAADMKQGEAAGVDSHAHPVLQRPQVRGTHASQVHRDVDRRRARGESMSRPRPSNRHARSCSLVRGARRGRRTCTRPTSSRSATASPSSTPRSTPRGKPFKVKSLKGSGACSRSARRGASRARRSSPRGTSSRPTTRARSRSSRSISTSRRRRQEVSQEAQAYANMSARISIRTRPAPPSTAPITCRRPCSPIDGVIRYIRGGFEKAHVEASRYRR